VEDPIEIANKYYKMRMEAVENIENDLKIIVSEVKSIFDDAEIYLFGSYVKGNFDKFLSDVDVLIVSDKVPNKARERSKIKIRIKEKAKRFFIFQLHFLTREEFKIYKKFIDKIVKIG